MIGLSPSKGWHGSYEGMYDAEIDAPIANLQTNPLQMNPRSFLNVGGPSQDSLPMSEHAAFDGEEKRVVSQISDAGGEGGDESAREGGSETDDIQSDIDSRAGRTGSTSFEVGMGNGVDSINLVYANDIEDKIKEKTKKMLGKLGGRSNMVSSRHVGGVKKNPMAGAGGGGSGAASGRGDTAGTAGGGGDDSISEGVESKRPDLMIALDDDGLNRTGSMEIDGGGKGDGDGGGGGGDGDGGGNVNEGAETKGADT